MTLLLPGTEIRLRRGSTPANSQDISGIPCVMGLCSDGPINTLTTLTTWSDFTQFGNGEGLEHAGDTMAVAGGPVYFCRVATSNPSVLSSVTKTLGNPVGTTVTSFGSVLIPGATATGDVLITAKQLAASIQVINPGVVTGATSVVVTLGAIVVTLKHDGTNITETGTGLAAAINGSVAAFALVSAAAQGGGAGIAGALATTALDDGAINFTGLQLGVSFEVLLSGNNTAFATAYNVGLKKVTVTLATDANGRPTTTATQALTAVGGLNALALANPGVFVATLVGAGSKLLGAKALTTLPFGSNGAATVAGPASDKYTFVVEVIRAGTVGGLTPVGIRWTCDGITYSSEVVLPNTGILLLKDKYLNSGVTITLTGTLDLGDKFSFTSTLPTANITDILSALDVVIADTSRQFGYVNFAGSINRAQAVAVDAKLQAAFQRRQLYGYFSARDKGEGVPGETEDQWKNAINADFAGFTSDKGALQISAGSFNHVSPYTSRQFLRPNLIAVTTRKAQIPMHENIGAVKRGPIRNCIGISHDENVSYGLNPQRFITTRTHDGLPGEYYFTDGYSMASPSDVGYTLTEKVVVIYAAAREAKKALLQFTLSSFAGITVPESASVPAGALSFEDAAKIKDACSKAVSGILNLRKSDGEVSCSSFSVTVLRDYSFLLTREIRVEIEIVTKQSAEKIICGITSSVPA